MEYSNIVKALLKVQGEITNPPNTASNPFFKSKYAPLPDILKLVRPLLTKNGLILLQNTGSMDDGSIYVQTQLLHSSGEHLESDKLALRPDKNTPQGIGSAITYGRRYQLSAMLGISSEDDDDGNAAEKNKETTPKTTLKSSLKSKKQPQSSKNSLNSPIAPEKLNPFRKENGTIDGICGTLEVRKKELTKKNILKEAQNLLNEDSILQAQFNKVKEDLNKIS